MSGYSFCNIHQEYSNSISANFGIYDMSVSPGPSASVAMPTVAITDRLQAAAAQGQLDVVKDLVQSGIPIHPDREGRSALHFAALNGNVDVCDYLLEHGCDLNAQDSVGYSPLHRAASQGHVQALEFFLKKGCAVDTPDENGNAAVHEAAWNGYSQTLDLLIKFNCNIQITNKAGFTALHLSAQNGHNQSTRVLLLAGCNADVKNNYGDTALHTAARYGHAGVTRILISARCSLNEQNKNGDTALHIAAALKRRKIAKLLVDASIDVYVRNKQNETAMEVARRKDHQEIIVIISSFARPKTPKSSNPKVVNFKDVPVDIIEGPVVVPDNETPAKPEKQEKKFFDFFRKKKKDKDKDQGGNTPQGGAIVDKDPAVQGFFSQYIPRPGLQYYRDLAGNIKQGPIGYTPVCQCMPTLKKLEHQVHTNKEAMHDHIEASNRALTQRMDQIDRRTSEQVHNLDRFTKDRFVEEEHNCRNRIQQRIEEEREYMKSHYQENIKLDVQDWLEAKLGTYGHCLDHHHDDTALPSNNIFSEIHHTENGRLYKSRSDETLSQSDNHSGKFRKKDFYESRTAAMQQIRAWQVPNYSQGKGRTRDINDNVRSANYRTPNGSHALIQGQAQRGQGHYAQGQYMGHSGPGDRNISASQGQMANRNEPIRRSNMNFASKQDILSPSTESTSKSPYSQSPNDPMYGHYAHHGAIPKRMSHSQTVHNGEQWIRESSPVTQSTPKINESSHVYGRGMVRSKTDSEGFLKRPDERDLLYKEQFRRNAAQRQSAPNRSVAHSQEMENSRSAPGFQKNSDVRQSFQERGSSNTNVNTGISPAVVTSSVLPGAGQGPQESNSRPSSGKSDEKSENHYNAKPTFTTFGYEETKKAPQSVSQNVYGEENSSNSQRPASSMRQEYPYSQPLRRSQTPNDELERSTPRRGGQPVYGFFRPDQSKVHEGTHNTVSNTKGPSQNPTNRYPEVAPKPVLRQRTRSSDGLLEDGVTSAHELAQRSKSEERTLDSAPNAPQIIHSQTPQTPRSSSETRPQGQQNYVNSNAGVPYRYQGYTSVQSQPGAQRPQHLAYTGLQQPYHQHQHSFSHVKSLVANQPRYTPHEQFNRGQDGSQGLRENPYASVRNVSQNKAGNVQYGVINKQGLPYRSTYNVNYTNQGEKNPFRESSPIVKSFSKSESNLDRSLNDSDHDPGYTSPVNPRGDFMTCRTPTGEISANRDNAKSVANYPNAYNKEDSSSNPDSGYSSKIFGSRTNAGNVQSNSGTPSSSFSTDHDHSMSIPSNNNSPHPQVSHSDYEQIQNVRQRQQAQGQNLQNHVQSWYQKKLQEAAQRLREGPYNKEQGDSPPPTVSKHNQYHYGQPTDIYNNQSNYPMSQYHSNKDYVNSNYQRIFIRGSDV